MEKTATLNLRVNPDVKQKAEEVLVQLGIPMSTAINMYLNQIALVGGIPFSITLPNAPKRINADLMSAQEIRSRFQEGFADVEYGRVAEARETFQRFKESCEQ